MVRDTSIAAFHKIREEGLLSDMRLKVYSGLFDHGPCTANELFMAIGGKHQNASNITTRLGELREMGVAEELGKRDCSVTGMQVTLWDVTSKLPKPLVKKKTKKESLTIIYNLVDDLQKELADPLIKVTRMTMVDKLKNLKESLMALIDEGS